MRLLLVQFFIFSQDLISDCLGKLILSLSLNFSLHELVVLFFLTSLLFLTLRHDALELLNFLYFTVVVFLKLFLLFFELDLCTMLVVFALLFVPEVFCCLFNFLIKLSDSKFELNLCLLECILLNFGVVKERLLFVIVALFVGVSILDFLYPIPEVIYATINFRVLFLEFRYFFDAELLLVHE